MGNGKRLGSQYEPYELYEALFEQSADGILLVNDRGIVRANRAFASLHGVAPNELIGHDPAERCTERAAPRTASVPRPPPRRQRALCGSDHPLHPPRRPDAAAGRGSGCRGDRRRADGPAQGGGTLSRAVRRGPDRPLPYHARGPDRRCQPSAGAHTALPEPGSAARHPSRRGVRRGRGPRIVAAQGGVRRGRGGIGGAVADLRWREGLDRGACPRRAR